MNSNIYIILASISAGVATFCGFLAFINFIKSIHMNKEKKESTKTLPVIFKMLLPFTSNIMFIVKSSSFKKQIRTADENLTMAGLNQLLSGREFIAVKILSVITGVIFLILTIFIKEPLMGLILFGLLVVYPSLWLKKSIKKRHLEIQKALPNVLDLLTLSVEAGKDFLTAIKDIVLGRKMDALNEELSRTLREIQLGKPRRDALKELADRVRQEDLVSVMRSIIQADELGVSIGQLLRIQGDQLRSKRFQRAEKLANEAPVKMLFPMVVFIFPAVFIILMAPIIMQAFKSVF